MRIIDYVIISQLIHSTIEGQVQTLILTAFMRESSEKSLPLPSFPELLWRRPLNPVGLPADRPAIASCSNTAATKRI